MNLCLPSGGLIGNATLVVIKPRGSIWCHVLLDMLSFVILQKEKSGQSWCRSNVFLLPSPINRREFMTNVFVKVPGVQIGTNIYCTRVHFLMNFVRIQNTVGGVTLKLWLPVVYRRCHSSEFQEDSNASTCKVKWPKPKREPGLRMFMQPIGF